MAIKITSNADEVAKELTDDLAVYQKNLQAQVWRALSVIEAQILQNIRKDSGLHVRTGALLNSIGASKKVYQDTRGYVTGEIGPEGIPYAAIHEFGGTILPKNKQFLTIPSEQNRRPDGLPKVTTAQLMADKKNTFIANNTIFMKSGSKITPMFFLKKSVTIPARPYVQTALAAKKEQILNDFGLFLQMSFNSKVG